MAEDFQLCEGCKQPDHCGGLYPDDDPHRPGQLRGCFKEKTTSVRYGFVPGGNNIRQGDPSPPNPAWEQGRVYEDRGHGVRVPILDGRTGSQLGVHEWAHRRSTVQKQLREMRSKPSEEAR